MYVLRGIFLSSAVGLVAWQIKIYFSSRTFDSLGLEVFEEMDTASGERDAHKFKYSSRNLFTPLAQTTGPSFMVVTDEAHLSPEVPTSVSTESKLQMQQEANYIGIKDAKRSKPALNSLPASPPPPPPLPLPRPQPKSPKYGSAALGVDYPYDARTSSQLFKVTDEAHLSPELQTSVSTESELQMQQGAHYIAIRDAKRSKSALNSLPASPPASPPLSPPPLSPPPLSPPPLSNSTIDPRYKEWCDRINSDRPPPKVVLKSQIREANLNPDDVFAACSKKSSGPPPLSPPPLSPPPLSPPPLPPPSYLKLKKLGSAAGADDQYDFRKNHEMLKQGIAEGARKMREKRQNKKFSDGQLPLKPGDKLLMRRICEEFDKDGDQGIHDQIVELCSKQIYTDGTTKFSFKCEVQGKERRITEIELNGIPETPLNLSMFENATSLTSLALLLPFWRIFQVSEQDTPFVGSLSSLSNLVNMEKLALFGRGVRGCLCDLKRMTMLKELTLNVTDITGSINTLSNMKHLSHLELNSNRLGGSLDIVRGMANLSTLIIHNGDLGRGDPEANTYFPLIERTVPIDGNHEVTGSLQALSDLRDLKILHLAHVSVEGSLEDLEEGMAFQLLSFIDTMVTGYISHAFRWGASLRCLILVKTPVSWPPDVDAQNSDDDASDVWQSQSFWRDRTVLWSGDKVYIRKWAKSLIHYVSFSLHDHRAGGGYGMGTRLTNDAQAEFRIYKWTTGQSGPISSGEDVYIQATLAKKKFFVTVSGRTDNGFGIVSLTDIKDHQAQFRIYKRSGLKGHIISNEEVYIWARGDSNYLEFGGSNANLRTVNGEGKTETGEINWTTVNGKANDNMKFNFHKISKLDQMQTLVLKDLDRNTHFTLDQWFALGASKILQMYLGGFTVYLDLIKNSRLELAELDHTQTTRSGELSRILRNKTSGELVDPVRNDMESPQEAHRMQLILGAPDCSPSLELKDAAHVCTAAWLSKRFQRLVLSNSTIMVKLPPGRRPDDSHEANRPAGARDVFYSLMSTNLMHFSCNNCNLHGRVREQQLPLVPKDAGVKYRKWEQVLSFDSNFGKSIEELYLADNHLSEIVIPSKTLEHLSILDLSNNHELTEFDFYSSPQSWAKNPWDPRKGKSSGTRSLDLRGTQVHSLEDFADRCNIKDWDSNDETWQPDGRGVECMVFGFGSLIPKTDDTDPTKKEDLMPESRSQRYTLLLPEDFEQERLCRCLGGFFNFTIASDSRTLCTSCPRGKWSPEGNKLSMCNECPTGATTSDNNDPAISVDTCYCKYGRPMLDENGTFSRCGCAESRALFAGACEKCEDYNLDCDLPGMNLIDAPTKSGYIFLNREDHSETKAPDTYHCVAPRVDERCPRDPLIQCGEGYTGSLCQACLQGYFDNGDGCTKCQNESSHLRIIVKVTLGLLVLVTLALAIWWSRRSNNADAARTTPSSLNAPWLQALPDQLGFFLVYGQLLSVASSLKKYDPSGPALEEQKVLDFLKLDIQAFADTFRLQCVWDPEGARILQEFSKPLLLPVSCCLIFALSKMIGRPDIGLEVALKLITVFFIGGAQGSALLLRCQDTDAEQKDLPPEHMYQSALPFATCSSPLGITCFSLGLFGQFVHFILVPAFLVWLVNYHQNIVDFLRGRSILVKVEVEETETVVRLSFHDIFAHADHKSNVDVGEDRLARSGASAFAGTLSYHLCCENVKVEPSSDEICLRLQGRFEECEVQPAIEHARVIATTMRERACFQAAAQSSAVVKGALKTSKKYMRSEFLFFEVFFKLISWGLVTWSDRKDPEHEGVRWKTYVNWLLVPALVAFCVATLRPFAEKRLHQTVVLIYSCVSLSASIFYFGTGTVMQRKHFGVLFKLLHWLRHTLYVAPVALLVWQFFHPKTDFDIVTTVDLEVNREDKLQCIEVQTGCERQSTALDVSGLLDSATVSMSMSATGRNSALDTETNDPEESLRD